MYDEIVKMWQGWGVTTESDMDLRLHNYRILFAYHSSKIENYFLMLHNHPPLIIYAEDKQAYYEALDAYDKEEDIEPLHLFLVQQTVKTWELTYSNEMRRSNA